MKIKISTAFKTVFLLVSCNSLECNRLTTISNFHFNQLAVVLNCRNCIFHHIRNSLEFDISNVLKCRNRYFYLQYSRISQIRSILEFEVVSKIRKLQQFKFWKLCKFESLYSEIWEMHQKGKTSWCVRIGKGIIAIT